MNTVSYNIETLAAGPGVARLSVRGTFGFPELAGQSVAYDLTNTTATCYVQQLNLSSGANTITKPSSAGAVVIVPPVDNTYGITLKGVGGDTGVPLHKTAPTQLTLDQSVSTFVLTAGSAINGFKLIWL